MTLHRTVSDEVRALAPDFTHVVIEGRGLVNGPGTDATEAPSSTTRPAASPPGSRDAPRGSTTRSRAAAVTKSSS